MTNQQEALFLALIALVLSKVSDGAFSTVWTLLSIAFAVLYGVALWVERR